MGDRGELGSTFLEVLRRLKGADEIAVGEELPVSLPAAESDLEGREAHDHPQVADDQTQGDSPLAAGSQDAQSAPAAPFGDSAPSSSSTEARPSISSLVTQAAAPEEATPPEAYDSILQRVLTTVRSKRRSVQQEKEHAPRLLDSLLTQPEGRRELMIRNSARHRSVALCRAMLIKSAEYRYSDPRRMLTLARTAALIAEALRDDNLPQVLIQDLRAEAQGAVGNALRLSNNLDGADVVFQGAFHALGRGTGDPLLKARMLSLLASLRTDQRRLAEALRLLDRSHKVYRSHDEVHAAGRILVQKGMMLGEAGQTVEAVEVLEEGLRIIDRSRDQRLATMALHNLILFTLEGGKVAEAWSMLEDSRELYSTFADPLLSLRRRWLEGKIAAGLHRPRAAERAFVEARSGFEELEMPYEAALVGLDLSLLIAKEGRLLEIRLLVEDILTTFQALRIDRESIAALLILSKALESQRNSLRLLPQVLAFLRRANVDAEARFEVTKAS